MEQRFVFIATVDLKNPKILDLKWALCEQGAKFSSSCFTMAAPFGHVLFACSEKKICMCKKKKEALFDFIKSMICAICFLVVFSDYLKHTMYLFQVKKKKELEKHFITERPKWKQSSFSEKRFWSGWILRCLICYLTVSPAVISTVPIDFVWI